MKKYKIKIEMWKLLDIPSVKPNQYLISSYGRVKNKLTGKILKGAIDKDGYIVYGLPDRNGKIKTRKGHRLVAEAFLKSTYMEDKNHVNHKNGDKQFNFKHNLEWCDIAFNNKHARDTGLNKMKGIDNNFNKFSNNLIKNICELIQEGFTNTEIINKLEIPSKSLQSKHALISSIRHMKAWTHISKDYNLV